MSELSVPLPPSRTGKPGFSAEALISLRTDMLRFAQLQLRNRETAEDMVQEAIEGALRNAASFAGNSSLKTWVFAILKTHLMMCPGCSNYRRQLFTLRDVARAYADGRAEAASPSEKSE